MKTAKKMELNRWSYVFWDWNGTIVDDLNYNYNIVNTLLLDRDLPPIRLEEYREKFCFPIRDFYRDIGFKCDDAEYALIAKKYEELYESQMSELRVFEDLLELMLFLHEIDVKQYIFSSANQITLNKQLAFYPELVSLIDGIICQNNNLGIGKLDQAIKWKQEHPYVDWAKVLIIGDTYYESEIASRFGTSCILINSGHQSINSFNGGLVFDSIGQLANNKELFLL